MTMSSEVMIDVCGVSKKFARSLRKAMIFGLADISRAALMPRRFRSAGLEARITDARKMVPENSAKRAAFALQEAHPYDGAGLRFSEFWALRNVSFQLSRGDCVGVVGHNGAGKSTLFSILSGIYGPTEGRVTVHGRLQALIALGAGFHPLLSGRENVYINGCILGLRVRQIEALMEQIIAFSELEEFMDAPVRSYSSGMKVRLGYSIVAHLNPDILLVDEVLAVGDSKFQAKCQDHMREVMRSGTALMLVSHYMQNIQGMCNRAIWLNHGRMMMEGDVMEVTGAYQRHLFSTGSINQMKTKESTGGFSAIMDKVVAYGGGGQHAGQVISGDSVDVELTLLSSSAFECGRYYVVLMPQGGQTCIASFSMLLDGTGRPIAEGENVVRLHIPSLTLTPGCYQFYACVRNLDGVTALSNGCLSAPIEVLEAPRRHPPALPVVHQASRGLVELAYQWSDPS
ncbi:MAG: ABC transporter ATP-binding protein [Kiritimatiellae bacterium]|nr:ABC transporter ATP-binding protein [Kiritimatiellia bacterium]